MDSSKRRHGRHGDGSVYFDHLGSDCREAKKVPEDRTHKHCSGQWAASISLGKDPRTGKYRRVKVYGRTKTEALNGLKAKRQELDQGISTSATYTVKQCVNDWLAHDADDLDSHTKDLYRGTLNALLEIIGEIKLRDLTTLDVRKAFEELTERWSDRTFQIAKSALSRALNYAMANNMVSRNVAALAKRPKGRPGWGNRAMTLEQALDLMEAAKGAGKPYLEAYVVLCLTTGIRTEEARALTWDHVDLDGDSSAGIPPSIAVWKSVRRSGDTKTTKSRRTLELPHRAAQALREQRKRQAAEQLLAGPLWRDSGLVFTDSVGQELAAYRVNRDFQALAKHAGLAAGAREGFTPRMLRHTYISVMSAEGVPLEEIARQAGHTRTSTTEGIYRKQLKPVMTRGAEAANRAFG